MKIRWSGTGFAFLLAIAIGGRIALRSVSFIWTLALVAAVALAGITLLVRRWRARPIPEIADPDGYVASRSPVAGYSAIPYRRNLAMLALIIFSALSAGCVWVTWELAAASADSGWAAAAVAFVGLGAIFGVWWTFVMLLRWLPDRAGLYVDSEGILIATNGPGYQRVLWRDIRELRWAWRRGGYGMTFPYLAVDLAHPDVYLARQTGWRRRVAFWEWKTATDPVKINVGVLDAPDDELVQTLKRYAGHRVRIVD